MDFLITPTWRDVQLMNEKVVWPVTASFLVLVCVFFLAIDASQKGDLTNWLSGMVAVKSIGSIEYPEPTVLDSPQEPEVARSAVPVHLVGYGTVQNQNPGQLVEFALANDEPTPMRTQTVSQIPRADENLRQPIPTNPVSRVLRVNSEGLIVEIPLKTQDPVAAQSSSTTPQVTQHEPAVSAADMLNQVGPPLTLEPRATQPSFEDDLPPDNSRGLQSTGLPEDETADQPLAIANPLKPIPLEPSPSPITANTSDTTTAPSTAANSRAVASSSNNNDDNSSTTPNESPWPVPEELVKQVLLAGEFQRAELWAESTLQTLQQFRTLKSVDDHDAEILLSQLASQINQLDSIIVLSSTGQARSSDEAAGPLAARLRALNHQLIQYWSVSGAIYRLAVLSPSMVEIPNRVPVISVNATLIKLPSLDPDWDKYLLLDELQQAIDLKPVNVKTRRRAAQHFLSRLTSPVLDADQQQFLVSRFDPAIINAVRELAFEPVNLRETLEFVDAWRRTGHGFYSSHLASVMQGLAWQDDENSRLLSETIDQQLRAANLRISVSDEMLNRLLPAQPDISEPVHENMMGAEVNGHSRIANRLQIRLIPDPHQIQLRLESFGLVRSITEARQRGFVVDNVGDSDFRVFKRLTIGRNGIQADRPLVDARSSSRVVGMTSKYDGMPIMGWVARRMASRQIAEQTPQANKLVEQKLQSAVSERFEEQIDGHLYDLQDYLATALIQPLSALELEPAPLEMRSTEDRIIMQYRMAGRDQLAASTLRPMGHQKSLMSMQVHESLINNVLARVDLAGQSFSGTELSNHLADVFGQQASSSVEDSRLEFQIEFSSYDPVAIHFQDGKAIVELNIRSLKVGRGKTWRNLTVQATYMPVTEGSRLRLVQDMDGISLKDGTRYGFRDQAAIRTIFTAMFRGEYVVNLIPQGIAERLNSPVVMGQFDLTDGWLAMSVDLATSPNSTIPPAERPNSVHSQAPAPIIHR